MTQPAPIAVALDAPDLETAARWAGLVTPHVSTVKVGLELYLRYGPGIVASIRGASGVKIFLDLKLHDIPATVAGAARAVARLHPDVLTVHAAGGPEVIRAAVEAAPDTMIAAVTLLTSLGPADLERIGVTGPLSDAVRRLAVLAVAAGARGLVCSPREVADVRAEVGPDVMLITPGIRPPGAAAARPGADGDPGRGSAGRSEPAGDRAADHRRARPGSGRGGDRGSVAPLHARSGLSHPAPGFTPRRTVYDRCRAGRSRRDRPQRPHVPGSAPSAGAGP